ncbi:hypothetical protein ACLOJK_035576 [Asimina triloba]
MAAFIDLSMRENKHCDRDVHPCPAITGEEEFTAMVNDLDRKWVLRSALLIVMEKGSLSFELGHQTRWCCRSAMGKKMEMGSNQQPWVSYCPIAATAVMIHRRLLLSPEETLLGR